MQDKFLKKWQNKYSQSCVNINGKSEFFLSSGTAFQASVYFGMNIIYLSFSSRISNCSPANPSLLGINIGGGAEVKLRLRRPNREWDFFPYEQILDTMLHELCHNEYGPHNADFYKLWDEIRKVCLLLQISINLVAPIMLSFCQFLFTTMRIMQLLQFNSCFQIETHYCWVYDLF